MRLCAELPFEPEQLRERHERGDDLLVRFVRPRSNLAPPHQEALEDGLNVPGVRAYDDLHHWLQNHWLGLLRRLLESHRSRRSEGGICRVSIVVRTVVDFDSDVDDRIPAQDAVRHRLLDAAVY